MGGGWEEGTHFHCGLMKEEGEANPRKPLEVPQITLHWHIIRLLCVELARDAKHKIWCGGGGGGGEEELIKVHELNDLFVA